MNLNFLHGPNGVYVQWLALLKYLQLATLGNVYVLVVMEIVEDWIECTKHALSQIVQVSTYHMLCMCVYICVCACVCVCVCFISKTLLKQLLSTDDRLADITFSDRPGFYHRLLSCILKTCETIWFSIKLISRNIFSSCSFFV